MTTDDVKAALPILYEAYKLFLNTNTDPNFGEPVVNIGYGGVKHIQIQPNLEGFMKWCLLPPPTPPAA